jgi:hypothetical protein
MEVRFFDGDTDGRERSNTSQQPQSAAPQSPSQPRLDHSSSTVWVLDCVDSDVVSEQSWSHTHIELIQDTTTGRLIGNP